MKHPIILALGTVLVIATLIALMLNSPGCSTPPAPHNTTIVQPAPPPPDTRCDDGAVLGSIKDVACPAGQVGAHKTVCTATGYQDASNTCAVPPAPTCGKITFADVQPIFAAHCSTCHAYATSYAGAQSRATEIARRTLLSDADNDHMPQQNPGTPANVLSADELGKIQSWVTGGAIQDCSQANAPSYIDLNYQDTTATNDAVSLSEADRPFTRYVFMGHAVDGGASVPTWVQAVNKALNGVNEASENSFTIQSIEPTGSVYRFDLRSFGFGPADIAAIEKGDVNINIVDRTSKGQVLGALLQTKKPWFHADNLIDIMYRNSTVYYQLIKVPATLKQLQADIGIDFQGDLNRLQSVNLIGSTSSPIAEQKNRLIARDVLSRNNSAYYWQTFDVNSTPHLIDVVVNGQRVKEDTKNLVQFPLLAGAGSAVTQPAQEVFTFDASEVIYSLPNGHQAYALFDGAGKRINFADPDVVIDTATPVGNRVINAANSCTRCHNAGTIPMADQILASVKRTGLGNANDVAIVNKLYGASAAAGNLFRKDNAFFAQALAKIGVDPLKPDPQSIVTDRFLTNYDLKKLAALLFLTPQQLTDALASSPVAQGQLANVLSDDGTVTFTQLVGALPTLIADAKLFQDAL